jgi:hypothetical protein
VPRPRRDGGRDPDGLRHRAGPVEAKEGAVHLAPWLLEEFAEEVPFPAYLSEVYPTATALEVERHPLNELAENAPLPARRVEVVERELAGMKRLGRPGQ